MSGHELSLAANRHFSIPTLDEAIADLVNAHARLDISQAWGDGSTVAADGTHMDTYLNNLLSETSVRYGKPGGNAYHHISDTYIALFTHFIPCGVWEAVYIIEGLLKNTSEVQPTTVHADTQGQSFPVFALAHLLGFDLHAQDPELAGPHLLREGLKGAAAARVVGVSTSCGSLWFIDAGSMIVPDPGPISPRFLTQDDRIAIADGLHAKQSVKEIAASIGKSFQTVYREIKRNAKPDGRYQPWWAHNQALLRRHRPKKEKIRAGQQLRTLVREKLTEKWSPQQIARYLAREHAHDAAMRACPETIYRALFRPPRPPRRQTPHRPHPPQKAATRRSHTHRSASTSQRLARRPRRAAPRMDGRWRGRSTSSRR